MRFVVKELTGWSIPSSYHGTSYWVADTAYGHKNVSGERFYQGARASDGRTYGPTYRRKQAEAFARRCEREAKALEQGHAPVARQSQTERRGPRILCHGRMTTLLERADGRWTCLGCGETVKAVWPL